MTRGERFVIGNPPGPFEIQVNLSTMRLWRSSKKALRGLEVNPDLTCAYLAVPASVLSVTCTGI
jgi:hypothetical protein